MDGGKDIDPVPARPDEAQDASRIGVDDWVASHEGRRDRDAFTGRERTRRPYDARAEPNFLPHRPRV